MGLIIPGLSLPHGEIEKTFLLKKSAYLSANEYLKKSTFNSQKIIRILEYCKSLSIMKLALSNNIQYYLVCNAL